MNSKKLKYLISIGASLLLVLHVLWPTLGIDITTIALLFVVILPFSGPLLRILASSGVKSLEFPGGIKIELAEVKAAADKVIRGWANIELPAFEISATASVSKTKSFVENIPTEDPIAAIREVANTDSNLSLVAFRIEIEKRLRSIAENFQIKSHKTSLGKLIRELQNREILPPDVSTGLMDLVALGNRAAHGVEVDPPAADWVLDIGASIILKLDNILGNQKSHNNPNSANVKNRSSD
ncbi:MAG: DUF4145 domain-containing protein [Bacteroidales bacterium]|nr:DUF4145 domain-containing protein [Bacteroidales bacterium]